MSEYEAGEGNRLEASEYEMPLDAPMQEQPGSPDTHYKDPCPIPGIDTANDTHTKAALVEPQENDSSWDAGDPAANFQLVVDKGTGLPRHSEASARVE